MTDDEEERYRNFEKEITSRSFGFRGARQRILNRLDPLAPKALDLKRYKAALLEGGLESPELSDEFRKKFLDSVAFLCCLSRQASDLKWKDTQIQKWKDLGLNVDEELAKRSFETPVPVVPPVLPRRKKEAPPAEPQPEEETPPQEETPAAEEQPRAAEPEPQPEAQPEKVVEEVVPSELEATLKEEPPIPPVVPIPIKKEETPPQEEETQPETPEEQTPPPAEPEQKETPKEEEEAPRAPPQPRAGGARQTPEKCKHFPLNLDLSPKDIRQQTLVHLVELLNEVTAETDASQVSAACLAWAANAEIYERLHMTTQRRWTAPDVVEGAPTPSHWLALKLQTALDVKDIKGSKENIKHVTRCTRICIDAVTVMGSLMDKKRLDKPDAPVASPASALATALNVSLDAGDTLPLLLTNFSVAKCSTEKAAVKANLWSLSLTIFMSALSWYHVGVECLVQIKQEHRHLLAYLALPEDSVTDSFLSFVEQYNGILAAYKPQSSKAKSTVEKAAKICQPITLSKEKTNMPEAVGEANLDLGKEWKAITKMIKG
ncbi:hypothetical protein Emed_004989 [Eimeria media]